jgi:hypothetical protein
MNRNFVNQQVIDTKGATHDPDKAIGTAWLKEYCLKHGWQFRAMGRLDLPTEPVVTSAGYRIVPYDQDDCWRPAEIISLVDNMAAHGLTTDRMLIIHLPDEDDQPKTWPQRLGITPQNAELIRKVLIAVGTVATIVAVAAILFLAVVALVIAAFVVIAPIIFVGLALVGMAVGFDPVLVYVNDANEWYECAAWREE